MSSLVKYVSLGAPYHCYFSMVAGGFGILWRINRRFAVMMVGPIASMNTK
ncbi:hypothetical protein ACVBGC_20180 [Burkholderia stagnalis]